MKIIDLLNKISNGEEVPKKIKYAGIIWKYDNAIKDYISEDMFLIYKINSFSLNKSFEIIEQEHKIPEKIDQNNFEWEYLYSKKSDKNIINNLNILRLKYNEIIDYLEVNNENKIFK